MGWKGTLRSLEAAARAADRERNRRLKFEQHQEMVAQAEAALEAWSDHINSLQNVHQDRLQQSPWKAALQKGEPEEPKTSIRNAQPVLLELQNFKPSWFDFLYGGTQKRKDKLSARLSHAKKLDKAEDLERLSMYQKAKVEWQLANQLSQGKVSVFDDAVEAFFSDDMPIERMSFEMKERSPCVQLKVHDEEIVPDFRLKQLKSGKLSESKMPKGDFYSVYSNYVASSAFRTASDIFNILPVEKVYVTCVVNMLNPTNGYMEDTPILSTMFVRETLMTLNLDAFVPFDGLRNFKHVVEFKRTSGFGPITPL